MHDATSTMSSASAAAGPKRRNAASPLAVHCQLGQRVRQRERGYDQPARSPVFMSVPELSVISVVVLMLGLAGVAMLVVLEVAVVVEITTHSRTVCV